MLEDERGMVEEFAMEIESRQEFEALGETSFPSCCNQEHNHRKQKFLCSLLEATWDSPFH
jgi:hypothetical protein